VLQVKVWCSKLQAVNFTTGHRKGDATRHYVAVREEIPGKARQFRKG